MEKILNKLKKLRTKLEIIYFLLFANKAYLFICHDKDVKDKTANEVDIGDVRMSCEPGNIDFDTRRMLYYSVVKQLEIRNATQC